MFNRTLVLIGFVVMGSVFPSSPGVHAQENQGFAGSWIRDADLSDDPPPDTVRPSAPTRGMHPTREDFETAMRDHRELSREQIATGEALTEIMRWHPAALQVEGTCDTITIMFGDGESEVLYTDQAARTSVVGGIEIKTRARGNEERIKVEYTGPGNAMAVRIFKLGADGATLEILSLFNDSWINAHVRYKQVYRRAG
jgi:hypothetical protein